MAEETTNFEIVMKRLDTMEKSFQEAVVKVLTETNAKIGNVQEQINIIADEQEKKKRLF